MQDYIRRDCAARLRAGGLEVSELADLVDDLG
jgi:hypothetical protein